MFKLLFLSILLISYLNGANNRQLQIIAKHISVEKKMLKANGDVLIFSPNYYITANRVIYDKQNEKLELWGNVHISKNKSSILVTSHTLIDMKNSIAKYQPVLLIDNKTNIWMDAKEFNKNKDLSKLDDARLSSCDCKDPAWNLGFSKADYNTTSKWINTYNNTLYIKKIPAWYFLIPLSYYLTIPQVVASYFILNPPYLGFSFKNDRESGFLRPNIGYSKAEGYIYEQPIYLAPDINYEFEYIPKIRTLRGQGHELIYRYKDSINSQLNMKVGVFKENDEYQKKNNIKNQTHYGINIDYKRKNIFNSIDTEDGVLLSFEDINDIEYKNTKYKQKKSSYDKIIQSQLHYFYNTQKYYTDLSFYRYRDISIINDKDNRDDQIDHIFQTTPKINIDKYLETVPYFNFLSYSFNVNYHNKTRIKGITANIVDGILPINFNIYILNNYLQFRVTEETHIKYIDYANYDKKDIDAKYISQKHLFNISSNLLKPYEDTIHTFELGATYTKYNDLYIKGEIYGINSQNKDLINFLNERVNDILDIYLDQNIYLKSILKTLLTHKIKQSINFDIDKKISLQDLENEFQLSFLNSQFTNKVYFNHDDNLITKSTFAFEYKDDIIFSNIDFLYSLDKNETTQSYKDVKAKRSISYTFGVKLFKYYNIEYKNKYNITNDTIENNEIGLNIAKECWQYSIKYSDSLVASASNDEKPIHNKVLYFQITLKPFLSLKQEYILNKTK